MTAEQEMNTEITSAQGIQTPEERATQLGIQVEEDNKKDQADRINTEFWKTKPNPDAAIPKSSVHER